VQLIRIYTSCYFIPHFLQHISVRTDPSSRRTTLRELCRIHDQILLHWAQQPFISFGLLNNSIPCLYIYSHLTLIPNFNSSKTFLTSSSHLNLDLPILLTAFHLHSFIPSIVLCLACVKHTQTILFSVLLYILW